MQQDTADGMANGGEDPQLGHRLRRVGGCGGEAVVETSRGAIREKRPLEIH